MAKKKKKTQRAGAGSKLRRGIKTKAMSTMLTEVNIDWLTTRAEAAGISRSGFLDKLLDSLRTTEGSVGDTGLFDVYSNQMEKLIDQIVEQRVQERTR